GLEEAWMPSWRNSGRGRRESLLLGVGRTPRLNGGALGYELTLAPGWGHIYFDDDIESAFSASARGAVLVKLPCLSNECSGGLTEQRSMLVFEAGGSMLRPLGFDAPWVGEGMFSVGYRCEASLLP
ncbi:MAG: hypothetical protein ACOC1F_02605, partial [Myxococcota bacterium]